MAVQLRTKMALTHGAIAVLTIVLVVAASYLLINSRFLDYVTENKLRIHQELADHFKEAYQVGVWDQKKLSELTMEALENGYLIELRDKNGSILWESNMLGEGLVNDTMLRIEERIREHYGPKPVSLQSHLYELKHEEEPIGELEVKYYSKYFLTDHELMFLRYLNKSLLWVAGISLLLALGLSTVISSSISNQLSKIIEVAKSLARGETNHYKQLTDSSIVEIAELGVTINDLGEEIKEKEASNKRLSADIAHELRTPLTTLQSHLEALMEGIWQPTPDRLASCHEEIVRMAGLVNDLEQLNKYDVANIKLVKTTFDFRELLANIITNFERDFTKKNVALSFVGELVQISADREKIGQVIVNLISNSLKYTHEGGRVLISLEHDQNFVYLVVNDNGIGISPQDQPYIFDRLYRADPSRTRATGGAGIGLAIAKAIVETHKGQISVISQENKGTEFTVILPKK